jgi:hypothetical protein
MRCLVFISPVGSCISDVIPSPKITGYVHDKGHIDPSFWTHCAINAKKPFGAVRVWAVSFPRESFLEAVCLPAFHGDLQTFIKARDGEKIGIDVLGAV